MRVAFIGYICCKGMRVAFVRYICCKGMRVAFIGYVYCKGMRVAFIGHIRCKGMRVAFAGYTCCEANFHGPLSMAQHLELGERHLVRHANRVRALVPLITDVSHSITN